MRTAVLIFFLKIFENSLIMVFLEIDDLRARTVKVNRVFNGEIQSVELKTHGSI